METVCLGLGANIGDRQAYLEQAINLIEHLQGVERFKASDFYQTSAVGPVEQEAFLNAAARLDTDLEPEALLKRLGEIETKLGRTVIEQRQRWGPRVIDLDILLFGQRVIDQPELQVPHPRMHERWFVLKPLADLAADITHPVLGRTIRELLADLSTSDQNRAE